MKKLFLRNSLDMIYNYVELFSQCREIQGNMILTGGVTSGDGLLSSFGTGYNSLQL